mgnify:CR=1 FL=1
MKKLLIILFLLLVLPYSASALTLTVYPDPDPETTSVDGNNQTAGNGTWSVVHDATTGTVSDSTANIWVVTALDTGLYQIARGFILFDTSSLPDDAVISAATVDLTNNSTSNTDINNMSLGIVASTPASNTAIAAGDFDNFTLHSDTVYGSIDLTAFIDNATHTITLNAGGITAIDKTGITKYGLRISGDYNETAGHGSAPGGANETQVRMSETAGTASDPALTITYTVPSGAAAKKKIFIDND